MQQKRHIQQQHHYQDSLGKNKALANSLANTLKEIEIDINSYEKVKNIDDVFSTATFNNAVFKTRKDASEHLFIKWREFRYQLGGSNRNVESRNVLSIAGFNVNFEKTVNCYYDQYTINVTGETSYSLDIKDVTEIKLMNMVMSILNNLSSTLSFNKRHHENVLKDIDTANENIGKDFIYIDSLIKAQKRLIEVERELMDIQDSELEEQQKVA